MARSSRFQEQLGALDALIDEGAWLDVALAAPSLRWTRCGRHGPASGRACAAGRRQAGAPSPSRPGRHCAGPGGSDPGVDDGRTRGPQVRGQIEVDFAEGRKLVTCRAAPCPARRRPGNRQASSPGRHGGAGRASASPLRLLAIANLIPLVEHDPPLPRRLLAPDRTEARDQLAVRAIHRPAADRQRA